MFWSSEHDQEQADICLNVNHAYDSNVKLYFVVVWYVWFLLKNENVISKKTWIQPPQGCFTASSLKLCRGNKS